MSALPDKEPFISRERLFTTVFVFVFVFVLTLKLFVSLN